MTSTILEKTGGFCRSGEKRRELRQRHAGYHYNLLYREDERELIPICRQQNVALKPYSPLAAGRLSRLEWKADTKRSRTDKTAMAKYDRTQASDYGIVLRVNELAEKYGATMTQIALAWLFAKGVTSPIVGATRAEYFDDAAST